MDWYLASIEVTVGQPHSLDLSSRQREQLRQRSKFLFGNQDRLEVLVAIARSPDGLVNASDLQWEIGIVQSRIRNQLVSLSQAGLLSSSHVAGKNWYQRLESPIWAACLALYADWIK